MRASRPPMRAPGPPMRASRVRLSRALLCAGLGFTSACRVVVMPAEPPAPVPGEGADRARMEPPTRSPLPAAHDPVRRFDEVRAVWVVRFTLTSEDAIRAMVDEAERTGINTLIVQVRGRADAFYRSSLEPRGESVRESDPFDPLELVIREGHARGMAVHAWVNTHLVWGPAALPEDPDHIMHAHPDWLAVPRELGRELVAVDPFDRRFVDRLIDYARDNPGTVEGVYTSPSHPGVQERVHAVWLDLASRYDLDGIHFDYIRFPSAQYDYSIGALERFRLWARSALDPGRWDELDEAYEADLYAFVDSEPELWAQFRREHVTRLVERVHRDVKAIRPRLTISAAVIADTDLALNDRFQAWPSWLERGLIDVAVPMAYTPDSDRFRSLVESARAAAGRSDRVWAGIGAYMNTAESTMDMIDIARAQDAGGVVLFSYDWAVGEGKGDPERPFLRRIGEGRFGR